MLVRLRKTHKITDGYQLDAGTFAEVYAIIGRNTLFRRRIRKKYLICLPESNGSIRFDFYDEKELEIIDNRIPDAWVEVQHKKNQIVVSWRIDESCSVIYSYFNGPEILLDPTDNLLRLALREHAIIKEVMSNTE